MAYHEPLERTRRVRSDLAAVKKAKNMEILGWGENQSGEEATYLRYTTVTQQLSAARSLYPAKNFNQNTMIAAGRYIKRERVYCPQINSINLNGCICVTRVYSSNIAYVHVCSVSYCGDRSNSTNVCVIY